MVEEATGIKNQGTSLEGRFSLEQNNPVFSILGRGERIRTSDLFVPNEARYQTAPRPDSTPSIFEFE